MSKRKLTRRQSWRVEKIQQERTARATKRDDVVDEQLEGGDLGQEQHGLIISHFGRQVDVEGLDGDQAGVITRCHMRTNLGQLVTGDRIIWRAGTEGGVVVAQLPRQSELVRPNPQGELRPVAANIDFIVVTIAVEPTPFANLVDRYLVASELSGIEPVILLNKSDLLHDGNRDELLAMLENYRRIGYRVLTTSANGSDALTQLKALLNGRVSVFVGQSGVGKSSLINSLLPGVDIRVGELSAQTRKGRHTTTTARLFHFPDGGDLIDSPGIREFGLWHLEPERLIEGFREFHPYLGHCRFRDCRHEQEPGCAIKDAIEQNEISASRVRSFQHIRQTLLAPDSNH